MKNSYRFAVTISFEGHKEAKERIGVETYSMGCMLLELFHNTYPDNARILLIEEETGYIVKRVQ